MFSQASMKFKRLGDAIHLSGPIALLWNRISFSRLTLFYFCFSLLHFVIQLSFQIKAFSINANASSFLSRIVDVAQTTNNSLPFLDGNVLRMCSWVPANLNVDVTSCPVVWNGTNTANQVNPVNNANAANNPLPYGLSSVESVSSSTLSAQSFSSSSSSSSTLDSLSTSTSAVSTSTASTTLSVPTSSSVITSSQSTARQANSTQSAISTPALTTFMPTSSSSSSRKTGFTTSTKTVTVFASSIASPQATTISGNSEDDGKDDDNDEDSDNNNNNNDDDDDDDDDDDESDREDNDSGLPGFNGFRFKNFRRSVEISLGQDSTFSAKSIVLTGLQEQPVVLNNSCLWSLNWPVSELDNTKREDMVFMGFQVWVLGMSLVAILNESIPHIIASLATHIIATGWAAFQIDRTARFRADFDRVITNGACHVSLIPNYWSARARAELPSLVLNIIALFVSSFLTWKLIKLFGWQTFKRVGASLKINRIYRYVLLLSITIQLSLFFMIVTVSLWVDQLMNSVIGDLASFQRLYKVTSLITLALLIPWLMTGWFAVRRELKIPMIIFMVLSILYLGGWGIMFISTTFRWTFITWTFFSIMACTSVFLTVMSIVLGIVCGLNFGKGLARYLNAQTPIDEEDNASFYTGDHFFEKVDFPSSEKPLPTYASLDYKQGYQGTTMGPRFANQYAEPFETVRSITYPAPTVSRNKNELPLQRSDSHGSTRSAGSSHSSQASQDSSKKRWVIE